MTWAVSAEAARRSHCSTMALRVSLRRFASRSTSARTSGEREILTLSFEAILPNRLPYFPLRRQTRELIGAPDRTACLETRLTSACVHGELDTARSTKRLIPGVSNRRPKRRGRCPPVAAAPRPTHVKRPETAEELADLATWRYEKPTTTEVQSTAELRRASALHQHSQLPSGLRRYRAPI